MRLKSYIHLCFFALGVGGVLSSCSSADTPVLDNTTTQQDPSRLTISTTSTYYTPPSDVIPKDWKESFAERVSATVGDIYIYDNPYTGDTEYFRLKKVPYWYFPINKTDDLYWSYLGKKPSPKEVANLLQEEYKRDDVGMTIRRYVNLMESISTKNFGRSSTLYVGQNLSDGKSYQKIFFKVPVDLASTWGIGHGTPYKIKTNIVNGVYYVGEVAFDLHKKDSYTRLAWFKLVAKGSPIVAGKFTYYICWDGQSDFSDIPNNSFTVEVLPASEKARAQEMNRVPLPGQGISLKNLSFSKAQVDQKFNYKLGWSGSAFGVVGSQFGAPEYIKVIADPTDNVVGNYVLAMNNMDRTAQWMNDYQINTGASQNTLYKTADASTQDDIWVYGTTNTKESEMNVSAQIYLPKIGQDYQVSLVSSGFETPLNRDTHRGIAFFVKSNGTGIFSVKNIGIPYYFDVMKNWNVIVSSWWTVGMSVKNTGEIFWFIKQGKSDTFTEDDLVLSTADLYDPIYYQRSATSGAPLWISLNNFPVTTTPGVSPILVDNLKINFNK